MFFKNNGLNVFLFDALQSCLIISVKLNNFLAVLLWSMYRDACLAQDMIFMKFNLLYTIKEEYEKYFVSMRRGDVNQYAGQAYDWTCERYFI